MAQLNFHVPEALLSRIDASKPEYLDRKGFLCLLIEQGLDRGFMLGKPSAAQAAEPRRGEGFTSKAVTSKEEKKLKEKRFLFSVPEDLSDFKADLLEYWREHKSGKKTQAAASILISGCRKIKEQYGDKALAEQLELAKGYGWENITLKNYERFGLQSRKGYTAAQEQPNNHPASRVFTAADFDMPNPDNPLNNLF